MTEHAATLNAPGEEWRDLLEPFARLIHIEICGDAACVPENNHLLRCFQFLHREQVSMGDFCWNGDCANCLVSFYEAGETSADARPALACRTEACEGMVITKTSLYLRRVGIPPSGTNADEIADEDRTNNDANDGGDGL